MSEDKMRQVILWLCSCNGKLRCVGVNMVAVKKQFDSVCVCVCVFSDPARKAQTPYCHSSPVRLYTIFPHYLIKGTIFLKKSY